MDITHIFASRKNSPIDQNLQYFIGIYRKYQYDLPTLQSHDHFDLVEETVLARSEIHDLLSRATDSDIQEIREIDSQWQKWIIQNRRPGFALVDLDRKGIPKEQWWFWIDQIDQLSEEQLKTL